MPNQAQIRQQITEKIIDTLERDLVPWRRPWSLSKNAGRHSNVASNNAYSGVNPLLLELHAIEYGFQFTCWGTFQQWKKLGGSVQKRPPHVPSGKWGCQIVFYKPVAKNVLDAETGEKEEKRYSLLRTYTVFNAEQVEGLEQPESESSSGRPTYMWVRFWGIFSEKMRNFPGIIIKTSSAEL